MSESSETEPTEPEKAFAFHANLAIRTGNPEDAANGPTVIQLDMYVKDNPIHFIVETPDPFFLEELAAALVDSAATLRLNPLNEPFYHKHSLVKGEPPTVAPAAADVTTPVPATGESE